MPPLINVLLAEVDLKHLREGTTVDIAAASSATTARSEAC
jgi:hypothetical protein